MLKKESKRGQAKATNGQAEEAPRTRPSVRGSGERNTEPGRTSDRRSCDVEENAEVRTQLEKVPTHEPPPAASCFSLSAVRQKLRLTSHTLSARTRREETGEKHNCRI